MGLDFRREAHMELAAGNPRRPERPDPGVGAPRALRERLRSSAPRPALQARHLAVRGGLAARKHRARLRARHRRDGHRRGPGPRGPRALSGRVGPRAHAPLIVDTVVRARDALTRDLGVTWPKPTRITVVRDLMSLSAMTGLPQKDAQTTGTVAVAKWGRVTLLSPRASQHGYSWRDTNAHEMTHLAVTRATIDHAPLWLQEGVAKRQETRWRDRGPFDDRPSPDAIAQRGMELKLDLPLDRLGPSIAMLPSADAAMVAFAEVTSFVRYMADESPPDALEKLFAALRAGSSPDAASARHDGGHAEGVGRRVARTPRVERARVAPRRLRSRRAATPTCGISREAHARLAELLFGSEAPVRSPRPARPRHLSRSARGPERSLLARAHPRVAGPGPRRCAARPPTRRAWSSSFGPWWAIRGRWARAGADNGTAEPSFYEAVAADPLDVESACEGLEATSAPKDPRGIRTVCRRPRP